MAVNPDEDTEFNDALRKAGIIPPKEPPPATPSPPSSPTLDDILDELTPSELQEISEDVGDDLERTISEYRRQRISELRQEEKKSRFGQVYPIARDDYTREVTEASKVSEVDDDEDKGTAVICFLYQDGIPRNQRAFEHVRILAVRYPRTKFVSIVGSQCIPNLPDSRTPMFIIYKKGDISNQVVAWGADRERRIEELESLFLMAGAITPHRRLGGTRGQDDDVSDDGDEDDGISPDLRSATTRRSRKLKNIRSSDSQPDSDFEFDL